MVETEKLKSAIPVRVEDGDAPGHPPHWAQDPAYHGMTGPAVKITVRDNDQRRGRDAPTGPVVNRRPFPSGETRHAGRPAFRKSSPLAKTACLGSIPTNWPESDRCVIKPNFHFTHT